MKFPRVKPRRWMLSTLKFVAVATIVLGLAGGVGALACAQKVTVFGNDVPAFVFGAVVAFMGVRYWFRVRDMSRDIAFQSE